MSDWTTIEEPMLKETADPIENTTVIEEPTAGNNVRPTLNSLIQRSTNPDDEQAKVEGAQLLSRMTNIEPSKIYKNWDYYVELWTGVRLPPKTAGQAIKQAWEIGEKNAQLGQLGYRLMMGEDVSREIEEIQKSMPMSDEKDRNLAVEIIKNTALMLPLMKQGLAKGARQGLITGGGAAGVAALAGQAGPQIAAPEEIVTVPSAFVSMFSVGSRAGTMENISKAEAGLAYLSMLDMTDEEGNKIDPGIARNLALGVGAINGAIEMFQIGNIPGVKKFLQQSSSRTLRKMVFDGSFKRLALESAKKYGGSILAETGQEIVQETVSIFAEEVAKDLQNTAGGKFQPAEIQDIKNRLVETGISSLQAFSVIGLPGTIAETIGDTRNAGDIRKRLQGNQKTKSDLEQQIDTQLENIDSLTSEELDALVNVTEATQPQHIVIETKDGVITPRYANGETIPFSYHETDDSFIIDSIAEIPPEQALSLLTTIQNENPSKVIEAAEGASREVVRAIENIDPVIAETNRTINTYQSEIEELQKRKSEIQSELDEAEEDIRFADLQEELSEIEYAITNNEAAVRELQEARREYRPLDTRKPWQMTSGEYKRITSRRTAPGPINIQQYINSVEGKTYKAQIRSAFSHLPDREIDAMTRMISMHAKAKGQDPAAWYKANIAAIVKADIDTEKYLNQNRGNAAFIPLQDGRAIITAHEQSDFSSFVHEMAHVFQRELTPEQDAALRDWTGFHGEWGTEEAREASEKFANGFEQYLQEGQAPHSQLEQIFRTFKTFLQKIYKGFQDLVSLTPDIRKVYDSLLEPEIVYAETETDPFTSVPLFQSAKTKDGPSRIFQPADTLEGVYAIAEAAQEDFTQYLDQIKEEYADISIHSRKGLKTRERSNDKVNSEYDGDASRLLDVVAATLEFKNPNELKKFVSDMEERSEVVRIKDRYQYPSYGYRDYLFNVRMPNGAIVEILATDERYFWMKKHGIGHQIYSLIRAVRLFEGWESVDNSLSKLSKRYYDRAEAQNLASLIASEREISRPWTEALAPLSALMGRKLPSDLTAKKWFPSRAKGVSSFSKYTVEDLSAIINSILPIEENSNNRPNGTHPDGTILFQSEEHEQAVRDALERGEFVPMRVLEEYKDTEWGRAFFRELTAHEEMKKELSWLYNEATEAENKDDFIKSFSVLHPEVELDTVDTTAFLSSVWEEAHLKPYSEASIEWAKNITDEDIHAFVTDIVAKNEISLWDTTPLIKMAALQVKAEKPINPKVLNRIKAMFINSPQQWREMLAHRFEDTIELEQINKEKRLAESLGETEEIGKKPKQPRRTRNELLKELQYTRRGKRLERGEFSVDDLRSLISDAEKEITTLLTEEKDLNSRIEAGSRKLESLQKETAEYKKEVERRDKQIKKLQDAIERRKEAEKRRTALRQEKERMRHLAKMIMKKPPKTVHVEFRELIETIQDGIDPHFRRHASLWKFEMREKYFRRREDAYELLPDRVKKIVFRKSLNYFTEEELQTVYDQIKSYIQQGRTKWRLIQDARDRDIKREIYALRGNVASWKKDVTPDEPILEKKVTKAQYIEGIWLRTLRPSRIADMLDGGKDFKGEAHRFFIDQSLDADNEKLKQVYSRTEKLKNFMEQHDIQVNDLLKEYEFTYPDVVAGIESEKKIKATADQILKMYANTLNQLNHEAQVFGNNISDTLTEGLYRKLLEDKPEMSSMIDFIMQEYEENFDRLEDANILLANERLAKEENYTPMSRMELNYTPDARNIVDEMAQTYGVKRGHVQKGMLKARQQIGKENQKPILMDGLYSEWLQQVVKQEHFINSAEQVYKMRRVLADQKLRTMIQKRGGYNLLSEMEQYVSRYANPRINEAHDWISKTARFLRTNTAKAALAGNLVTALKQTPSVMFYLPYTTPVDLLAAMGDMGLHWKETREFIETRDPSMKERSVEREYRELKRISQNKTQRTLDTVTESMMKPILMMDKLAVTAGWKAVYTTEMRKHGNEKRAIQAARDVTLRTQPATRPMDLPGLLSDPGAVSLFTQFSNQVNQIWNMITYDIPQSVKQGHIGRAAVQWGAIAMSAYVLWALSHRRFKPEDPEEWGEVFVDQFINSIPLLGPIISQGLDGWTHQTALHKAGDLAKDVAVTSYKVSTGENNKEDNIRAVKRIIESGFYVTGVPYVGPKRLIEGAIKGKPLQYILLGGEPRK